jgi:hypothetical protein
LSEQRSAEAVAEALGTHPENTRLFLDGLTASDLVAKQDGLYQNTPVAQAFLVENTTTFLGPILTIIAQTFFALDDLPKLVKEGSPPPPSPEADMSSELIWAQFAASIANGERADLGTVCSLYSKWRAGRDSTAGCGDCLGTTRVPFV